MSTNGRLLDSELAALEGVRLAKGTANAFRRMDAACVAATGVGLWPALPDGGYRDWATQGNIGAKNPDSSVPIAAQGSSTHGWGTRVDIGSFGLKWGTDGGKRANWLLAHASEFGFHREFGAADPNHFAHDGFTAASPILSGAGTGVLTPIEEEDMLSDEDRNLISAVGDIGREIRDFLGAQGGIGTATANTISAKLDRLGAAVSGVDEAVWGTQVGRVGADGKVVGISALQELADAKSTALKLVASGDVDEAAVARTLAPLLVPDLVKALAAKSSVDDADLAAVKTEILAAIAQVDENTLAAFGLKRA